MANFPVFQDLQFKDLSLAFENDQVLFNDVNVQLPLEEIAWIRGASGEGKSQLLKIMTGLLMPTRGDFSINGQGVGQMSFSEMLPYRLKMGYSFDYGGLLANRTIHQNLSLPLMYHKIFSEDDVNQRVHAMLERFLLSDAADLRPSEVTGGSRKAACVARAFLADPEMVLLDEPTIGLRAEAQTILADLILEQRQRGTLKHVYVASANDAFMEPLATKVIEISNKKLVCKPSVGVVAPLRKVAEG